MDTSFTFKAFLLLFTVNAVYSQECPPPTNSQVLEITQSLQFAEAKRPQITALKINEILRNLETPDAHLVEAIAELVRKGSLKLDLDATETIKHFREKNPKSSLSDADILTALHNLDINDAIKSGIKDFLKGFHFRFGTLLNIQTAKTFLSEPILSTLQSFYSETDLRVLDHLPILVTADDIQKSLGQSAGGGAFQPVFKSEDAPIIEHNIKIKDQEISTLWRVSDNYLYISELFTQLTGHSGFVALQEKFLNDQSNGSAAIKDALIVEEVSHAIDFYKYDYFKHAELLTAQKDFLDEYFRKNLPRWTSADIKIIINHPEIEKLFKVISRIIEKDPESSSEERLMTFQDFKKDIKKFGKNMSEDFSYRNNTFLKYIIQDQELRAKWIVAQHLKKVFNFSFDQYHRYAAIQEFEAEDFSDLQKTLPPEIRESFVSPYSTEFLRQQYEAPKPPLEYNPFAYVMDKLEQKKSRTPQENFKIAAALLKKTTKIPRLEKMLRKY